MIRACIAAFPHRPPRRVSTTLKHRMPRELDNEFSCADWLTCVYLSRNNKRLQFKFRAEGPWLSKGALFLEELRPLAPHR